MTRGDSRRCWAFAALFLDNGKEASVVTVSWVFPATTVEVARGCGRCNLDRGG